MCVLIIRQCYTYCIYYTYFLEETITSASVLDYFLSLKYSSLSIKTKSILRPQTYTLCYTTAFLIRFLISGPVIIKGKKKGQYFLLYKSYTYTRSTTSKKGRVWKCTSYKSDECTARMTTDDNLNVVVTKGEHTHKPPENETMPKHVYFTT